MRRPFGCRATADTLLWRVSEQTRSPRSQLASILPAALATLGLGLVLGPEAPLIALGLGLGALSVRLIRLEGTGAQLLVLAGAFAAVAALFGGPLIAAFLLFEVTAASGKIPAQQIGRALLPGFVAAGTGALVFTGVAGWSGLHQTNLALPSLPPYESLRITDLAWCLLMAVVVAAVVVALRHLAHRIAAQSVLGPAGLLIVAGLVVGALAVVFRATADRPVDLVLFSGQAELPAVVAEGSAGVLILLVVTKGLAYALSLGAGFRGGPVFPAIALGVAAAMAAAERSPRAAHDAGGRSRDRCRDDGRAEGSLHRRSARVAPHGPVGIRRRSDRGPRRRDGLARRHRAPESRGSRAGEARRRPARRVAASYDLGATSARLRACSRRRSACG